MEWSTNRRLVYGVLILLTLGLLSAYPIYKLTNKAPTCFDAKQNADEVGVDCGGVCALYCPVQIEPLRIIWAKTFLVTASRYDVAAYIENPNRSAGLKNLRYTFVVVDREGKELISRTGSTEITPSSSALIFEGDFIFEREPGDVTVTFNNEDLARWVKAKPAPVDVVTKNQVLKNTSTKPRFEATLLNTDLVNDAPLLSIGAIVYGPGRRPLAVSRTVVDGIRKGGSENIVFTWPHTFTVREGVLCENIVDTPLSQSNNANTSSTTVPSDCKKESFFAEIVITPRAIFTE